MLAITLFGLVARSGVVEGSNDVKHCHAISKVTSDKWCQDNCNNPVPNCPPALCSCSSSPPTPSPPKMMYDIIVIGSGVTGSTAAAEFAAQLSPDHQILILEAGGPLEGPPGLERGNPWPIPSAADITKYEVPGNYPFLQCWRSDCKESWPEIKGRQGAFQCKVLGGCGSMNGELTMYPPESDFDIERGWPPGWQWETLEPFFTKLWKNFNVTKTPSVDGQHYLDEHGSSQMRQALLGSGMKEQNLQDGPDPSNLEGWFRIPEVIASNGMRQSPATVFLPMALKRANVHMKLWSEVVQVIHSNGIATGVMIQESGKPLTTVGLKPGGAVVLASGTLNTARLLMRSGIASQSEITKMTQTGILAATSPVIINDHVGKGISDHPLTSVSFQLPARYGLKAMRYDPPPRDSLEQFLTNRTGGLTQYGPLLAAYFRDHRYSNTHDVELFVAPTSEDNVLRVFFVLFKPQCLNISVSLDAQAMLEWNSVVGLYCKEDIEKMSGAVDFTTEALKKYFDATYTPRPFDWYSGAGIQLSNHWVGSCAIGTCVDQETMALKGSQNIHVVDASLTPMQVTGHPWLTLAAIAARAATLISENQKAKSVALADGEHAIFI